ncbi:MAG: hypothetical protein GY765_34750 [bacterium]|nr:hypothetical protein [bacterium]
MKRIFILLIVLISALSGFSEKLAVLKDVYAPVQLRADDGKLYVSEKAFIRIYSLEDYAFIKKFGGEGEGPKEFKRYAFLIPQKDRFLINSVGKISYYQKDGTFIKEIRAKGDIALVMPVKDFFVARGFRIARDKDEKINYKTLDLYDSELNKTREIYKQLLDWQQGKGTKLFHLAFTYQTHGDRIYIAGKKDFVIDVFNTSGKKLFTISPKYGKLAFNKDHKTEILAHFKRTQPDNYTYWETQGKFPDYFPAVKRLFIRDQLLYVMTFEKPKVKIIESHKVRADAGWYTFYIYDLEGKLLRKRNLPLVERGFMNPFPFEIYKNRLYQVMENEETEETELHGYDMAIKK